MKHSIRAAAAAIVLLCGVSHAEELPPALQNLAQQGVEVVKRFDAPAGLAGYVINVGGRSQVIYVTGDGQHVLLGALLDRQGRNLTEEHVATHVYAEAWDAVEDARWVAVGAEKPKTVVYVLADPYCPYCHAFWQASHAYWDAGLQARWIMVSYLRPDGAAKVAAILDADDPAAALASHQEAFDHGGIEAAASPNDSTLQTVRDNTALMGKLGINGTPAILFKNAEGRVQIVRGMPKLDALPEMFQLPKQDVDAPGLERFR